MHTKTHYISPHSSIALSLSRTQTMINQDTKPHFVLVPLMAQGHMIPMVDLGRLLAEHGAVVTLITTPFNATRFRATIDRARESGLPIRFSELPFPCAEVGLPEGSENVDILPSPELLCKFFRATTLLRRPVELHLRQQRPYPTCLIADMFHPWTRDVACSLGIPRLTFFSMSCFTLLCYHNVSHYKAYDHVSDEAELFTVPGLIHEIKVTKAQALGFFDRPGWEKMREEVREAELSADGILINSFDDLELSYIESYQKAIGKKVWTVGPLSLYNKNVADMAARGHESVIDASRCMSWLDSKKPGSVVYVNFGSIARMGARQLMEISRGLEASNHAFIWVIKNSETSSKVEGWMSEGFEERTRRRGLVIRGWAPQVMILSHVAVGGFVTHCGWNSAVEGMAAGVTMMTWPRFADQFLNERMVVDVLRIGEAVGVRVPNRWGGEEGLVVRREEVERAVRRLMDGGDEVEREREIQML